MAREILGKTNEIIDTYACVQDELFSLLRLLSFHSLVSESTLYSLANEFLFSVVAVVMEETAQQDCSSGLKTARRGKIALQQWQLPRINIHLCCTDGDV